MGDPFLCEGRKGRRARPGFRAIRGPWFRRGIWVFAGLTGVNPLVLRGIAVLETGRVPQNYIDCISHILCVGLAHLK